MNQELLEQLLSEFPRIDQSAMFSILRSIKARSDTYKLIWLSRLECDKYWISQRQMHNLIQYLKDYWYISYERKTLPKWKVHLCCMYSLSDIFSNFLFDLFNKVKKVYQRIDVIAFIKQNFNHKKTIWFITFKYSWIKYRVNLFWRYKHMIYDTRNNCIINPITTFNVYN